MKASIVSEWRKIRTTRTAWLLGAAMVTIAVITAVATRAGEFPVDRPLWNPLVRNMPVFAGLFVLVLGVRAVVDEFRYGTIASTFLAAPGRSKVVAAKALVNGLVGLVFAVAAEAVVIGLATLFAAAEGPVTVETTIVWSLLGGAAAAGALTAMLGVGIGAIVRHQLAAVVGAVGWFLIAEELLGGFLKESGKWLPAKAAHGVWQVATGTLAGPWPAGIALATYAAAAIVAGGVVLRRRDVA